MGRPKINCNIGFCPPFDSFRPNGSDCVEFVDLTPEELECLRLKNIKNLDQTEAAKKMGVSQSTFQRTLSSAYKKVSSALIEGKELRILKSTK